ncbi:MAG: DUF2478 domain-containing protein [Hyphomicrobiales bacterium]|nr:DUF2478 domain-containing protein [Hyphomicrobiales bacterium]
MSAAIADIAMGDARGLTAIVYDEGAVVPDLARGIARGWADAGLAACGLVETQIPRADRRRCDMLVTELASGAEIRISHDRGALARGCVLDADGLLRAAELTRAALAEGAQRAMFNKFGKSEAEGGGLREAIADAIARGVPTIVFVPRRNLEAWRAFAGDLAVEIEARAFDAPPQAAG